MSSTETLKSKLYRYFFFGWMLEQPPGDIYGRNAARMRNRECLDRWLPHYIQVHAVAAALCALLLWGVQTLAPDALWVGISACFVGAEVCLTIFMVAAYAALRLQAITGDIDND